MTRPKLREFRVYHAEKGLKSRTINPILSFTSMVLKFAGTPPRSSPCRLRPRYMSRWLQGVGGPAARRFRIPARARQSSVRPPDRAAPVCRRLGAARPAAHAERRRKNAIFAAHTAITFRLLNGGDLDLITLARNCRTSVEMIDRFYATP